MVQIMERKDVVTPKEQGLSNGEVARRIGADRGTVSRHWNECRRKPRESEGPGADVKAMSGSLPSKPGHDPRAVAGAGARKARTGV